MPPLTSVARNDRTAVQNGLSAADELAGARAAGEDRLRGAGGDRAADIGAAAQDDLRTGDLGVDRRAGTGDELLARDNRAAGDAAVGNVLRAAGLDRVVDRQAARDELEAAGGDRVGAGGAAVLKARSVAPASTVPLSTVPPDSASRKPPSTSSPSARAPEPVTSSKASPVRVVALPVPLEWIVIVPSPVTVLPLSNPPDETWMLA